jgi:hypothetical protein
MDTALKAEFASILAGAKRCPVGQWLDTLDKEEREFFDKDILPAQTRRQALLEKLQEVYKVEFSVSALRSHGLKICSCHKTKDKK